MVWRKRWNEYDWSKCRRCYSWSNIVSRASLVQWQATVSHKSFAKIIQHSPLTSCSITVVNSTENVYKERTQLYECRSNVLVLVHSAVSQRFFSSLNMPTHIRQYSCQNEDILDFYVMQFLPPSDLIWKMVVMPDISLIYLNPYNFVSNFRTYVCIVHSWDLILRVIRSAVEIVGGVLGNWNYRSGSITINLYENLCLTLDSPRTWNWGRAAAWRARTGPRFLACCCA